MALIALHKDVEFCVGDKIRVIQRIEEGGKARTATFEGMVLAIKGASENLTFLVRRIGEAGVGIERIFPIVSPNIEKIEVVKKGLAGVRHSKLYYTRGKSQREVDEIYSRAFRKNKPQPQVSKKKNARKSATSKKKQ